MIIIKKIFLLLFIILNVINLSQTNSIYQFFLSKTAIDYFTFIFTLITLTSFLLIPLSVVYNSKSSNFLLSNIVLYSSILTIIFGFSYIKLYKLNIFYIITLYIQLIITFIYSLYTKIKLEKRRRLLFIIPAILFVFPLNFFMKFSFINASIFTYNMFNFYYFLFLFLFIFLAYISLTKFNNISKVTKEKILFFLSLSLLFHLIQRFSFVELNNYQDIYNIVDALPFYVCTFGVLMLPFAIYTHNKIFLSMLFLINTPGAIIVFINPPMNNVSIFSYDVTYFIFTHIVLFITTINLPKVFDLRITLNKEVKMTTIALLIYFVCVFFISVIFVNLSYDINFSFIFKSPIPVKIDHYFMLKIGRASFSLIYILALYIVHLLLVIFTYLFYKKIISSAEKLKVLSTI